MTTIWLCLQFCGSWNQVGNNEDDLNLFHSGWAFSQGSQMSLLGSALASPSLMIPGTQGDKLLASKSPK